MKKSQTIILIALALLFSGLALRAQTTKVEFKNQTRADVMISSDLFNDSFVVPYEGSIIVDVDNDNIVGNKKYKLNVFFTECDYIENLDFYIGKLINIHDVRLPCEQDGTPGELASQSCLTAGEDSAWLIVTNNCSSELQIIKGPYTGLCLGVGQSSLKKKVALGPMDFTVATFLDTTNRDMTIQSVVSRFAVKDENCIFNVTIKDEELSSGENFSKPIKRMLVNRSSYKISVTGRNFYGVTLKPHERCKPKENEILPRGFLAITVEYLDRNIRTREQRIIKHIGNDKIIVITDEDLGIVRKTNNEVKSNKKYTYYEYNRKNSRY